MPDSLNFQVKLASKTPKTKREILSKVTKLFDALGHCEISSIGCESSQYGYG